MGGSPLEGSDTRLRHLQAISDAALAHLRFDDLVDELLGRVTVLLGTDTAAVLLLDEESDELVATAARGLEEEIEAKSRVPLRHGFAGRVAAERRAVAISDVAEADIFNPVLRGKGLQSLLGVPLLVQGKVTGVLHVGTLAPREFTAEDAELLQAAADRIALAIDHSRLYEAERAARAAAERAVEQIRRIESITEVALHHIALDDVLIESLLARIREALDVDIAGLLVADESQQTLVARATDGAAHEVERGVEVPLGRGFAGRVAADRKPIAVEDTSKVEVISPLLVERGVKSLLGIPLAVEERVLGVLLVGTLETRVFSDDDLTLLELAGDRLTVALEHSRVYEREHFVAETLQRSLLPDRLPAIQGADAASRYVPGEQEAVGGDWYDVIPLRDGRVALAMGDVVSHGVRAASIMGQLRNALRAYAVERYEPSALAERLNGITREIEGREMATLAYVVFDPSSGSLVYTSAGHPPPLIVTAEGEVLALEDASGPPLGATLDALFAEAHARLEPGATLLLYTDGLVERRDMWIDEGIERLEAALPAVAGREPEELVDHVFEALLSAGQASDDIAVLAVRARPLVDGPLRLDLPADPTVLASVRNYLRAWLTEAGADEEEAYDVLVATTEAAANAVEHAYGPGDATFRVEAHCEDPGLIMLVVRDTGSWRPPRGQNRGRGTLLMQELMDDFRVATGESGTEVRMTKRLAKTLAVA